MNQGLIGKWSPSIGDPSIGGWTTVALYFGAAWLVWLLLRDWRKPVARPERNEHWFWRVLFVGLVFLGINKQLDLQSAFTEIGRMVANKHGWYADRRQFQMAFIAGIAIMGLTLLAALLHLTWGAPSPTLWALFGGVALVVFVVVRAASFHRVDAALGYQLSGLRLNWLLEMAGLLVIMGSAWRRRGFS